MVAKRYTREQFEAFPIDIPGPNGWYRFFRNGQWHVYDPQNKEAWDALIEDPPAPPVETVQARQQRAIEELQARVGELEHRLERALTEMLVGAPPVELPATRRKKAEPTDASE